MNTWRELAAPIIHQVIADTGTADLKTLRAALRDAYPFGQRKYHPYKIWCDEIRIQLQLKSKWTGKASVRSEHDNRQGDLF